MGRPWKIDFYRNNPRAASLCRRLQAREVVQGDGTRRAWERGGAVCRRGVRSPAVRQRRRHRPRRKQGPPPFPPAAALGPRLPAPAGSLGDHVCGAGSGQASGAGVLLPEKAVGPADRFPAGGEYGLGRCHPEAGARLPRRPVPGPWLPRRLPLPPPCPQSPRRAALRWTWPNLPTKPRRREM